MIITIIQIKFNYNYNIKKKHYRAYISSKIYREIKLRSGIINDKQLTLLPQEIVHSTLQDIWNLSLEQVN